MRELNQNELQAASGGVAPLVVLAVAIASHVVRHTAVRAATNGFGTGATAAAAGQYIRGLDFGRSEAAVNGAQTVGSP